MSGKGKQGGGGVGKGGGGAKGVGDAGGPQAVNGRGDKGGGIKAGGKQQQINDLQHYMCSVQVCCVANPSLATPAHAHQR